MTTTCALLVTYTTLGLGIAEDVTILDGPEPDPDHIHTVALPAQARAEIRRYLDAADNGGPTPAIDVHQHPRGALQVSINDDTGGYRLGGPAFDGTSWLVRRFAFATPAARSELRSLLDDADAADAAAEAKAAADAANALQRAPQLHVGDHVLFRDAEFEVCELTDHGLRVRLANDATGEVLDVPRRFQRRWLAPLPTTVAS